MNSNLDKYFKTDEDLVENGVQFAIDDKTHFLVRQFSPDNPRVKATMARHYKPYARQIDMGTLSQDKQNEIQIRIFIEVCLAGWEGVELEGKIVECNVENALALFKRLPALFNTLWTHANNYENYKEDLGNS